MKLNKLIALLTAIAAAGNAGMTTVTAAETTPPAGTLYGDANLDGKINVADAVAVLQFIANQTKYALEDQGRINADVIDAGEGITGLDAMAIQMMDAQLIKASDLPMTADEMKKETGRKEDKPAETSELTQEQLELMKTNPLIVIDGETNKPFIYGDLNGDMKLDEKDAAELGKLTADGAEYNRIADLNRDEAVDQDDADILDSYLKGEIPSFTVYAYYDSDNDGLNDFVETVFFDTDRLLADTDGDGLTDADEIYSANTDPKNAESAGNGVSDAEADNDEDGLTNIRETELGTDPNSKDSDGDGFDDQYEISTTKTSPVKKDTDGDGLTDSEEKELGLDPLNEATDGTPDKERIITQIISADDPVFSEVNTEDNAYELSVEINAAGYAKKNLSVRESSCAYVMQDGSALGFIPELIYNDDYKVESITLNFAVREPFRDNVGRFFDGMGGEEYVIDAELDGIKRLNVFRYFDSINLPMPVYTEYDPENNIVRVTIDSFETDENGESYGIGSYSLVDLEVWGRLMSGNSDEKADTVKDTADIDTQGFIRPAENVQITADNTATVTKTMPELSDDIRELIEKNYSSFADKNRRTPKVPVNNTKTLVHQWNGHRYAFYETISKEDKNKDIAELCEEKGGHLLVVDSELEFDYLLNGESKGKAWVFYSFAFPTTNNITRVPHNVLDSDGINGNRVRNYYANIKYSGSIELQGYSEPVAGASMACEKGYPGYDAGDIVYGYICEWEPDDEILDENVYLVYDTSVPLSGTKFRFSADSGTDSDRDGITDWDEIDHETIVKLGGKITDAEILWKNALQYINNALEITNEKAIHLSNKINKVFNGNGGCTPVISYQYMPDTDKDGINDGDDPFPNSSFNSHNKPNGFSYTIGNSINDFQMTNRIENAKATEAEVEELIVKERFPSIYKNPYTLQSIKSRLSSDAKASITLLLGATGDIIIKSTSSQPFNEFKRKVTDFEEISSYRSDGSSITIDPLIVKSKDYPLYFVGVESEIYGGNIGDIDLGVSFLNHYLENRGGTVLFDGSEVVDHTSGGYEKYRYNIGYLKQTIEKSLKPGKSIVLKSTPDSALPAWTQPDGALLNIILPNELNEFLALKECEAVIVAAASFDGEKYRAKVRYYVVDRYDFVGNADYGEDGVMAGIKNDDYVLLSYYDYAEPFDSIGVYEDYLTWKKE